MSVSITENFLRSYEVNQFALKGVTTRIIMNEVISNPLPRGGKTMNCKQINLDPPIRIKTTHNEYLSCSPDQGQQFLGLGFLI